MNKVTINFHGNLTQFGDSFTLYADTVNDAIRSLVMQIDGLKQHMRKGFYRLKVGKRIVTEKEYIDVVKLDSDCIVHISPRVAGAGKFGTFIVGAVLTAVGTYFGIAPLAQLGVGLMIGGVAQMLTKQPSFNQDYKGIEDSKSSYFTNLQNIVGQGKQIQRVYGDIRVGSVVVSESVSSHRTDGNTKFEGIQKPNYTKHRINLIPARDPDGSSYNLDLNADSVKEAATTISVNWS